MQIVYKPLFNILFVEIGIILQIEEFQNIGIANKAFRFKFGKGKVFLRIGFGGPFIRGEQHAIIVQHGNLPFQLSARPVLGSSFVHIPFTGFRFFNTEQEAVMGPAQFVTQCVTYWKCLIKKPHISQIACIKPFAEFRSQPSGQLFQDLLAILRAGFSVLLIFHDQSADLPICLHHCEIDRFVSTPPRRFQHLTDGAVQF